MGKICVFKNLLEVKFLISLQLGPEKGILHLAVAAIINAIWDLWAKLEKVPVWRLLTQMDAEVSRLLRIYFDKFF